MPRETLPNRRSNYSFTVTFQGERYDVTIGHYADGRTGEVFINRIVGKTASKLNTTLDDVCRDSAILMSIAIQHGTDLATLASAVTRNEYDEPSTIVGAIVDHLSQEDPDDHNDNPRPRSPPPLEPTDSGGPNHPSGPRSDSDGNVGVSPETAVSLASGGEWSGEDLGYSDTHNGGD